MEKKFYCLVHQDNDKGARIGHSTLEKAIAEGKRLRDATKRPVSILETVEYLPLDVPAKPEPKPKTPAVIVKKRRVIDPTLIAM